MARNISLDSKRPLTDKQLEDLVNASDFSDFSDIEDDKEEEEPFDSDDSVVDHDYVPDQLDEDLYNQELEKMWRGKPKTISKKTHKKSEDVRPSTFQIDVNNEYVIDLETHENLAVRPEKPTYLGKNGHVWNTSPVSRTTGKTVAKNIVYIRPGPTICARNATEPIDAFSLFFSDDILNEVLFYTNKKIAVLRQNYKLKNATVSDTTLSELKALLGLIFLSAALKNNHLSADILFDGTYCGDRYRATMSKERFNFLINSLRFDDFTTREERRKETAFAPISKIWNIFIDKCVKNYKPGSYVTIDEQLVGFRGRCPFRMYMPNKPNKYGIKIVMLCDVATKYVINASPYLGKSTNTNGAQLANHFVESLTIPLHGSNRNVTMDNWFTSVPLANKLLSNPYKLTIVGTLRKNKAEIPPELLENKSRQCGTSIFAFDEKMTLVSYKPKQNKIVLLLSTMHVTDTLNEETNKPEIIHMYNSTKGAVDTFDQMSQNICCNRKTRRWPLCVFYNMLNIASVNAFVIYHHNVTNTGLKPLSRLNFVLKLQEQLTRPWQQERLQNLPCLSKKLKESISDILRLDQPVAAANQGIPQEKGRRTYCSLCPTVKKRMTTTYCYKCNKAICGEHQIKICIDCSQQNL